MRMPPSIRQAAVTTWGTLLVFVLSAPAQKTPPVIGQVAASAAATLNGAPLQNGVTIFDGDVVSTGTRGEAVIKLLPDNEVVLNEKTSALFSKILEQTRLVLREGTVVVTRAGNSSVAVITPKFEIQPTNTGNAKFYVGLMADKSTYIESAKGQLTIVGAKSGKSYLLAEGQNTLVPGNASGVPGLQPERAVRAATTEPSRTVPAARPPAPRVSSSHNNHLAIGLGIAAAAAGGVAAVVASSGSSKAKSVSPSAP